MTKVLSNLSYILVRKHHPKMALKEAEARQKRILDADYSAVDLSYYAHTETHLRAVLIDDKIGRICSR